MGISFNQCRAARALLGWSQTDLEKASEVAKKTIADFEREARIPYVRTLTAIQRALEAAGVEFLPDNGVRLNAAAKSSVASRSGGGPSGQFGHTDQAGETGASKPTRSRKSAPRAKPAAMSKYEQIRALRERDGR